jgi:hypothetical protein
VQPVFFEHYGAVRPFHGNGQSVFGPHHDPFDNRLPPHWKWGLITRHRLLLRRLFRFRRDFVKNGISFIKTLNLTGSVDQFLFTGKKRVTLGTNLHPNVFLG